ncbi:hypothetical protein GCM10023189_11770 [Nibrella saemangeumensis]|uniref:Uncharacterized protein n=1 Tax=Nibrella saemangeumensis TaxID=1084526 RepID=A0ABP8MHL1_9BACT
MRHLRDIAHPQFRISVFAWNNKFIVKFENGMLEQTYKISELDVAGPEDVDTLLDPPFLEQVSRRFQEMDADWGASMERNGVS